MTATWVYRQAILKRDTKNPKQFFDHLLQLSKIYWRKNASFSRDQYFVKTRLHRVYDYRPIIDIALLFPSDHSSVQHIIEWAGRISWFRQPMVARPMTRRSVGIDWWEEGRAALRHSVSGHGEKLPINSSTN